jgi:hypothetical protein
MHKDIQIPGKINGLQPVEPLEVPDAEDQEPDEAEGEDGAYARINVFVFHMTEQENDGQEQQIESGARIAENGTD